jgi:hypothetical protein
MTGAGAYPAVAL